MLWLVVIVSLLNCVALSLVIWLAHSHLQILQRLERTLTFWTVPADPLPIPAPGTQFVPSDQEIARRERELKKESQDRAKSLRTGRR